MFRKTYELPCYDHRKSFHGKATVQEAIDGTIELKSYETVVLVLKNGKVHRTWNWYSATTMRHVNSFLRHFGLEGGGKAWWNSLPVEKYTRADEQGYIYRQENGVLMSTKVCSLMNLA